MFWFFWVGVSEIPDEACKCGRAAITPVSCQSFLEDPPLSRRSLGLLHLGCQGQPFLSWSKTRLDFSQNQYGSTEIPGAPLTLQASCSFSRYGFNRFWSLRIEAQSLFHPAFRSCVFWLPHGCHVSLCILSFVTSVMSILYETQYGNVSFHAIAVWLHCWICHAVLEVQKFMQSLSMSWKQSAALILPLDSSLSDCRFEEGFIVGFRTMSPHLKCCCDTLDHHLNIHVRSTELSAWWQFNSLSHRQVERMSGSNTSDCSWQANEAGQVANTEGNGNGLPCALRSGQATTETLLGSTRLKCLAAAKKSVQEIRAKQCFQPTHSSYAAIARTKNHSKAKHFFSEAATTEKWRGMSSSLPSHLLPWPFRPSTVATWQLTKTSCSKNHQV